MDNFQITFGYLRGWRFHNFPGQLFGAKCQVLAISREKCRVGAQVCPGAALAAFKPLGAVIPWLQCRLDWTCGMQLPVAEGDPRNKKSQAQLQESVCDTRIRASTSLPKATSCGVWVSISTKVMGINGNNTGVKTWQQGIPRSPCPMTGKFKSSGAWLTGKHVGKYRP